MENNKLLPNAVPNVHNKTLSLIDITSGKVLDVGCGRGALLHAIKKISPSLQLHGCDIDDESFKLDDVKFKIVNLNKGISYEDDYFDLVCCIEVIEHIENPFLLVREISRILKKDGILIISSPNVENIFSRIIYLFTGKFIHFFNENDFYKTGHINPIFSWKWDILLKKYFDVDEIVYNRGNFPIINIPLPTTRFTGEVKILKLKKKMS